MDRRKGRRTLEEIYGIGGFGVVDWHIGVGIAWVEVCDGRDAIVES